MSHWSTLQGQTSVVDKNALKKIFDTMDVDKNGVISLDEYKQIMKEKPNLFSWFDILSGQGLDGEQKTPGAAGLYGETADSPSKESQ